MEAEQVVIVRYQHFRYNQKGRLQRYYRSKNPWSPTSNGGMTTCMVVLSDGITGMGWAVCQPEDAFVYRVGRKLAYDRAVADALANQKKE
jgi:hypothetical protein